MTWTRRGFIRLAAGTLALARFDHLVSEAIPADALVGTFQQEHLGHLAQWWGETFDRAILRHLGGQAP